MRELRGNLVDVVREDVYPAVIRFDRAIEQVERTDGTYGSYILPGFIDGHIHIESSMLSPSRFGQVVVPHGTTAVVADPHEIANVLGIDGIRYMRNDAGKSPLKVFFTAPSCVPATPFETAGAELDADALRELMGEEDIVALGEVMNFPGVIAGDRNVMDKITLAKQCGKPVDGHAPLLGGKDLSTYIAAGISTDHECVTREEALEKARKGMKIMMRYGSASKSMEYLIEVAQPDWMIVSDDKHIDDLMAGHLDIALKRAVQLGYDPVRAVKAVTLNPAAHYGFPFGSVQEGMHADMVVVSSLEDFEVEQVFIDGTPVAEHGKGPVSIEPVKSEYAEESLKVKEKTPEDFAFRTDARSPVKVRVIEVVADQIITKESAHTLTVIDGEILPDGENDVLKLAVIERYGHNRMANAFIRGFSLRQGALASSIAHDSHNIICVGTRGEYMTRAVNEVIRNRGGLALYTGDRTESLALPIAGLMSNEPAEAVSERLTALHRTVARMGCTLGSPFTTLSFMALLVIPELKLSDRGLFDAKNFRFVDLVRYSYDSSS
jgi:adenine deaminase